MQRDAAEAASLLYFLYSYMQGECRKIWYAVLSAAAIKNSAEQKSFCFTES